jgi:nitrous oxidase accessory protein NosD
MSGDYSRQRFDPKNDFSGVLMQQGRVQLDADWNELVEILDRRSRTETTDIIGRCVVPKETPDGFEISISISTGDNKEMKIGRGRIYVDGLLVDNRHEIVRSDGEKEKVEFDPILAEEYGTNPIKYKEQPYFPNAPSLPEGNGPHLVYIDAWQREVTYLEKPDLIEKAVGVDTTTRLQTVWQVKVHPEIGTSITCNSTEKEWEDWLKQNSKTAPSAGRLSTDTFPVSSEEGPCVLPPKGGYSGLENQLYRVEIHDGGTLGTATGKTDVVATFKWSRDNASVASAVVEVISSNELKLASLGRDRLLRFNTDDWVEILDDWRELSGENGDPTKRRGEMRKITVDDTKQTIRFTPGLPADLIPTGIDDDTAKKRHLRVRLWNKGKVLGVNEDGSTYDYFDDATKGVIPVPPADTPIILENGVQITFSIGSSDGQFRVGDYWVFATRTADASVEKLEKAPPKGIHHHYGRLAIVTFSNPPTDCRIFWPPEMGAGCCTAVVKPGESIQAALDMLPETGGCVCLKTGTHIVNEPVRIEKSNIVLHGESSGARVICSNEVNLLAITNLSKKQITDVLVEGIHFEVLGAEEGEQGVAVIYMDSCANVSIKNCKIAVAADPNAADDCDIPVATAIAVHVLNSTSVEISGNQMSLVMYGVWMESGMSLDVFKNSITGGIIRLAPMSLPLGDVGIWIRENVVNTCRIERNHIKNYKVGINVGALAEQSHISGNEILRPAVLSSETEKVYGISVDAPYCLIEKNYLNLLGPSSGGIRVSGVHCRIESNILRSKAQATGQIPIGIFVGPNQSVPDRRPDHGIIRANTLTGIQDAIMVVGTEGVQVIENHIEEIQGKAAPRFAILLSDTNHSVVTRNQVKNSQIGVTLYNGKANQVLTNHLSDGDYGIVSLVENALEVSHNVVENTRGLGLCGIYPLETMTVTHNRFVSCGYEIWPFSGVFIGFGFGDLCVESCEVVNTGISRDGKQVASGPVYGIIAYVVPSCRISKNRIAYTNPAKLDLTKEHRALALVGYLSYANRDTKRTDILAFGSAMVVDNFFSGPGLSHLVEFIQLQITDNIDLRFEKVIFSNNNCEHTTESKNGATVSLWGSHLIVMSNHVKALPAYSSIDFNWCTKVALIGNVTTGGFDNLGSSVPTPPENYNVQV